jgi:hypothetical protein
VEVKNAIDNQMRYSYAVSNGLRIFKSWKRQLPGTPLRTSKMRPTQSDISRSSYTEVEPKLLNLFIPLDFRSQLTSTIAGNTSGRAKRYILGLTQEMPSQQDSLEPTSRTAPTTHASEGSIQTWSDNGF